MECSPVFTALQDAKIGLRRKNLVSLPELTLKPPLIVFYDSSKAKDQSAQALGLTSPRAPPSEACHVSRFLREDECLEVAKTDR